MGLMGFYESPSVHPHPTRRSIRLSHSRARPTFPSPRCAAAAMVFISQPLNRPAGAAPQSTLALRCPPSHVFPKGAAGSIFFSSRRRAPSPNQWRTTSLKHVPDFSSHIWSSRAHRRQIRHVEQPAGGTYRHLTSFNWGLSVVRGSGHASLRGARMAVRQVPSCATSNLFYI